MDKSVIRMVFSSDPQGEHVLEVREPVVIQRYTVKAPITTIMEWGVLEWRIDFGAPFPGEKRCASIEEMAEAGWIERIEEDEQDD